MSSSALVLLLLALAPHTPAVFPAQMSSWARLGPGVEYRSVRFVDHPAFGDGLLRAVRIDPQLVQLKLLLASEHDGTKRTAAQWTQLAHASVAINAGMFAEDQVSNVGYLRDGAHLNNPRWSESYKSALAFGPPRKGLPEAILVDLDDPKARDSVGPYSAVVQNLRMLKGTGQNVWHPSPRAWSEAAVAIDDRGRLLFLFSRSPLSVDEFNQHLLSLGWGVIRAMHVEGGPEASLSIHLGGLNLDLCGSYETGFNQGDQNAQQWPIPNVLAVLPGRPAP